MLRVRKERDCLGGKKSRKVKKHEEGKEKHEYFVADGGWGVYVLCEIVGMCVEINVESICVSKEMPYPERDQFFFFQK